MNTKNTLITVGSLIAILAIGLILQFKTLATLDSISKSEPSILGSSRDLTPFAKMATSSQATVTTSSTRLSATSTRIYAMYVNSGSNPAYLCLSADIVCTTATASLYLAAGGGSYEILPGENEYTGSITAITASGNTTINIGEINK